MGAVNESGGLVKVRVGDEVVWVKVVQLEPLHDVVTMIDGEP